MKDDDLFKQIASQYIKQYGENLHEELALLEQAGAYSDTKNLDKRVFNAIKKIKYGSYTKGLMAAAACLVIVFAMNIFYRINTVDTTKEPLTATDSGMEYALLSLSFELPESLSVSVIDQDKEMTIYHLLHKYEDHVILTLEPVKESLMDGSLKEIQLKDQSVYGLSDQNLKLLQFDKEDIRYTLTCHYELNTLLTLAQSIL